MTKLQSEKLRTVLLFPSLLKNLSVEKKWRGKGQKGSGAPSESSQLFPDRHRVHGVGRGGARAVLNQIPWNPVKIWLKSG